MLVVDIHKAHERSSLPVGRRQSHLEGRVPFTFLESFSLLNLTPRILADSNLHPPTKFEKYGVEEVPQAMVYFRDSSRTNRNGTTQYPASSDSLVTTPCFLWP